MSLQEIWDEISLSPPSAYRTRELVATARAAAAEVDTERSRELAPSIAALYFDTARGAAELVPVVDVVVSLATALERSPDANPRNEPRAIIDRARAATTQLVAQLRADIGEHPQMPASSESRQLAAEIVTSLLEVHRLRPSAESFRLYVLTAMAVYALLVPQA